MLFEYVQGGELFSRLRKEGRFSNDVGLFYACEILLTLIIKDTYIRMKFWTS